MNSYDSWSLLIAGASVVLTAVYVVATLCILHSNRKAAEANENQVKASLAQIYESQRQFEKTYEPRIRVDIQFFKTSIICLVIKNQGILPAENLQISIDKESLRNIQAIAKRESFQAMINSAFLKKNSFAGGEIRYYAFADRDDYSKISSVQMIVKISYMFNGKSYNETVPILLNEEYLISIDPLERIAQSFEKFHNTFESKMNEIKSRIPQKKIQYAKSKTVKEAEAREASESNLCELEKKT